LNTLSEPINAKKTIAYVDGFNLYYGALKYSDYKWINPKILLENVLKNRSITINTLNFYTARLSGTLDEDAPRRQNLYLGALETVKNIEIIYGSFQVNRKSKKIVSASDLGKILKPFPEKCHVIIPEEKGSDVNLGSHLVRDGFLNKFDTAIVCTNDTDLCEPIRIIVQELKKDVILITPGPRYRLRSGNKNNEQSTAKKLKIAVGNENNIFHMRKSHQKSALLDNSIDGKNGKQFTKPDTW
jgi:hypothetical protein